VPDLALLVLTDETPGCSRKARTPPPSGRKLIRSLCLNTGFYFISVSFPQSIFFESPLFNPDIINVTPRGKVYAAGVPWPFFLSSRTSGHENLCLSTGFLSRLVAERISYFPSLVIFPL